MGLPNLIYQGLVDEETLNPLGIRKLKSGLYSLPGDGENGIKRWYVAKWRAKVKIRAYIASLDHDFGNYHAHFERTHRWRRETRTGEIKNDLRRSRLRVTGSRSHPHFNGYMCWGNMASTRDYALDRHDIETASGIVALTLTTYNPLNPFGGWWASQEIDLSDTLVCISCGAETSGEISCRSCRSNLCSECAMRCYSAEQDNYIDYYCRSCLTDAVCLGESCESSGECVLHPNYEPAPVQLTLDTTSATATSGYTYDELPF